MASKSFIRKKPMQGIGERVLNGTILAVSATGGMYAMNKLIKPESKFKKYAGLVGIGLHLGAEAFVEQEQVLAAARGFGAAGAIHTTGNLILPGSKADFGLAGTDVPTKETTQEQESTPAWARIAEEAEREAIAKRAYEQPVAGVINEEAIPVQTMGAYNRAAEMLLAA